MRLDELERDCANAAIQIYWSNPKTRTFGELLNDCEESRALRAVLVGMLREALRQSDA